MFLSTVRGGLQSPSGILQIYVKPHLNILNHQIHRYGMKTPVSVDVLEQIVWPNTVVLWTQIDIGMIRLVCVFVRLNVPWEVSLTLTTASVGMECHNAQCLHCTVSHQLVHPTLPRWPHMWVYWPLGWSPSPYWSHFTSWPPGRGHTETSDTQGKMCI